jgi:tetratricopeptide (TPR) repeat protein
LCGTIALAFTTPERPDLGFGAAWFLITVLPVSNLLYTIGVVIAERVLYLPSLAVSIYAAYAWTALAGVPRPRLVYVRAGLILVLLLLGVRTITRNPDWHDMKSIMDATLRDHPESYRAQWSAAVHTFEKGDTAGAEQHWAYAIQLWPRDSQLLTELGAFNIQMKRYPAAAAVLEGSHRLHPNVARNEQFLALAEVNARRYPQALQAIDHSIKLVGPTSYLYDLRARAFMGMGKYAEAVPAWRASIREQGGDGWMQWGMLGRALAGAGQKAESAAAFDTAAVRAKDIPSAREELARMQAPAPKAP